MGLEINEETESASTIAITTAAIDISTAFLSVSLEICSAYSLCEATVFCESSFL
jgi:hypothetical protein